MLPVLEVSRLSSASSFYSAISQPLGLGYLPSSHDPSVSANATALVKHNPVLNFGDEASASPIYQIRQVDHRPLYPATLVLSANSLDAVNEFHAAALRAFPRSAAVIGTKESLNPNPETKRHIIPSVEDYFSSAASKNGPDASTIVARVTDFDGNTMAVEYYPYHQSSSQYRSYEPSRVLDYSTSAPHDSSSSMFGSRYAPRGTTALTTTSSSRNHQRGSVATSEMPASYYDHYSSARNDRMGTLRRSATSHSAASYESDPSTSSSQKGGMGVFGLAAAGAVGAMAGAAITYTVMRSRSRSRGEPAREYPYEYDGNYNDPSPSYEDAVPSLQRRETAPATLAYDQYPDYAGSRYTSSRDNGGMRSSRTRSVASHKDLHMAEDVYDYKDAASIAPPPSYHTRYSKAPSTHSRSRSRSEAPRDRAPLLLTSGSEKSAFGGYDYGTGYDGYEKGGYDKGGYEKGGYERGGYEKAGYEKAGYEKGGHDKGGYDKASYVSARTERTSRVPPNSSRSAPVRAASFAPTNAYSQAPSQAPSRRSRSSSRSRSHSHSHAYQEYAAPESHATLTRSSSSRAPPHERAESHATLRSRASGGRSYVSQSHRTARDRWDDEDRYGGRGGDYDDDDDDNADADSVLPDDSISCVGIRGRYH